MAGASFEEIRDLIVSSEKSGWRLVGEVMAAAGCDEKHARWLIALHAGHGFEFDDLPRPRPPRGPLARLEEALVVEARRAKYGPGVGGNALNALASELLADQEWRGVVEVRDELARRAKLTARAIQGMCRFGASVFSDALASSAPASYAVKGLTRRPSTWHLKQLAASRTWAELEPFLDDQRVRRVIAHERVARGEDLCKLGLNTKRGELAFALQPWEPTSYLDPVDDDGEAWCLSPELSFEHHDRLPPPGLEQPPDKVCDALDRLWAGWDAGGSVRVRGGALEAIAALDYVDAEVAQLSLAEALSTIARNGVRNRGGLLAYGRQAALTLLAALAGRPLKRATPQELAVAGARVRWYSYQAEREEYEWILGDFQLAIEDPSQGIAWAVWAGATD